MVGHGIVNKYFPDRLKSWRTQVIQSSSFQKKLTKGGGNKFEVLVSKLGEGATSFVVCFMCQLGGGSGFQELENRVDYKVDLTLSM